MTMASRQCVHELRPAYPHDTINALALLLPAHERVVLRRAAR